MIENLYVPCFLNKKIILTHPMLMVACPKNCPRPDCSIPAGTFPS